MTKLGEMFTEYAAEENGYNTLVKEFGFVNYFFQDAECFIADMYIDPESRKKRKSIVLLEDLNGLAKQQGCAFLTANTYLEDGKNLSAYTRKVRLMVEAGFEITRVVDKNIIWVKAVV